MNAIQFIKDNGIEKASEVVAASANALVQCKDGSKFHVSDLKRLVESIYLVKEHCTLERAKKYADSPYTAPEIKERLEQAIADYESIYSNDMGEDSHIENHISPLCKVEVK